MIDIGCVHGRFQPAHIEHLDYIKEAKARCKKLLIGITQFDTSGLILCEEDPHRSERISNPLTYHQRVELISAMLYEQDYAEEDFDFVPFPIDQPEKLRQFISPDTVCYTTIRDKWNLHKNQALRSHGYEVIVLWDSRGNETLSASKIREFAANDNQHWRKLVTPAVACYLDSIDFEGQMKTLIIESAGKDLGEEK